MVLPPSPLLPGRPELPPWLGLSSSLLLSQRYDHGGGGPQGGARPPWPLWHGLCGMLLCVRHHEPVQVDCGVRLDVVVQQRPSILKLLVGEDQTLLVWMNSFLVLDLGLDIVYGVRCLDVQGGGLACGCLDEHLHPGGMMMMTLLMII